MEKRHARFFRARSRAQFLEILIDEFLEKNEMKFSELGELALLAFFARLGDARSAAVLAGKFHELNLKL